MRIVTVMALGLVLACAPAAAQTQSTGVMEHYRAYNAAVESRDLATAEQEAAAALAAADAANDNRAGVLALNLALVRTWRNELPAALTPAQRALTAAQAGAPNVNPVLATLILGRAELAASGRAGADRLEALFATDNFDAPAEEIYPAAAELGAWEHENGRYDLSLHAWVIAEGFAAGASMGAPMGRAHALDGQAAAIISAEFRHRGALDLDKARDAARHLGQAYAVLSPLAEKEAAGPQLTVSQLLLAENLAWRGLLRAKLETDQTNLPDLEAQGDADGMAEIGKMDLTLPRCMIAVNHPNAERLSQYYPDGALQGGNIAATVVLVTLDETGAMVGHQVVFTLGRPEFSNATNRMLSLFHTERDSDSTPGCRMPRTVLQSFNFVLRDGF